MHFYFFKEFYFNLNLFLYDFSVFEINVNIMWMGREQQSVVAPFKDVKWGVKI